MIAMIPTPDQIREAAYFRWIRRGCGHGRDAHDWSAAEQDLLFALNYRVIVAHRLDEMSPRVLENGRARALCRLCEGAEPRVSFSGPVPAIPEALGNRSLLTREVCDACRQALDAGIFAEASRFVDRARDWPRDDDAPPMSIAAMKGLTAMALMIAPVEALETLTDALEWVSNPDHDRDRGAFVGLSCAVHRGDFGGGPWVALARRVEDDVPFPHLLFFLGRTDAVIEAAVPLNVRDEDLDGRAATVPRVASTALPAPESSVTVCRVVAAGPREPPIALA